MRSPEDQAWVAEFLRHKLGLMWMSQTADHAPHQTRATQPLANRFHHNRLFHLSKTSQCRVTATDLASTVMPVKANQNSSSEFPHCESSMPVDDVP